MGIIFTVTQMISDYVDAGEAGYKHVEVKQKFEVSNYDDLQNLLLTLIDFSSKKLKVEIEKELIEEVE